MHVNSRTIRLGIAGSVDTDTGQKTTTLVRQLDSIKDIRIVGLYNADMAEAENVLRLSGLKGENVKVFTELSDFVKVQQDMVIVTEMDSAVAHAVIIGVLESGKHVINLNAITECAFGFLYKKTAEKHKSIYTVGAGDEPAVTLDLIEYCRKLNLTVICAGKGKNNPMNVRANEDDFIDQGRQKNVNSRSLASFVDGTKTMLEMAILSNSSGFPIDQAGMHGPSVDVEALNKTFIPLSDGGILKSFPVIDFGIGNVAPGVFVVFTSEQQSLIDELQYLKMKGQKYFVLYKPYHLGNIESPLSIYDIVEKNKATIAIKGKYITMVVAKAKKDLQKGQRIDTTGGFSFYGFAVPAMEAENHNMVPLALIEKSTLKKDIKADEIFTFDHVDPDASGKLVDAWILQERMLKEAH